MHLRNPIRQLLMFVVGCLLTTSAVAQEFGTRPATQPMVRFAAVDVFIDPAGQSLGAYQVDFRATAGDVKLVGIEGGTHAAYKKPPYYDPKALQQSRVILAALSTDQELPTTKTRVARLHLQINGNVTPTYELKLVVAGDRDAKAIDAKATTEPVQKP